MHWRDYPYTRWNWIGVPVCLLVAFSAGMWFAYAALPARLMTNRLTSATTVASIPTKIAELEQSLADILGIPINTDINAALFSVDAAGLKKMNLKDLAGDPSAAGELARNGQALKFYDGAAVRTLATLDNTQTFTGKTLQAADNVINADTAIGLAANGANCSAGSAPLGVDSNGTSESCFDVATQTEMDTHTATVTGIHGVGAGEIAGTTLTQTFTNKTISGISNTLQDIPKDALKSATGTLTTATGVVVTMNDYSFFPQTELETCVTSDTIALHLTPSNQIDSTVGQFWLFFSGAGCSSGVVAVRWRYLTASRNPELVAILHKGTGDVVAMWRSELESQRAPIGIDASDYEVVYVADFPDEWLSMSLPTLHADLHAGRKRLKAVVRSGAAHAALLTRAQQKGRMVVASLPMVEAD